MTCVTLAANITSALNRYRTRSVTQTIFCPKFYECWRENTPSYDAILECTRTFFIGKHRYKVPCALQDGVIARKKISDVFLQPKHIEVSLLVWYLFCDVSVRQLQFLKSTFFSWNSQDTAQSVHCIFCNYCANILRFCFLRCVFLLRWPIIWTCGI
jgi:hypothetical protein